MFVVADHEVAFQGRETRQRVAQAELGHEFGLLEDDHGAAMLLVFVVVLRFLFMIVGVLVLVLVFVMLLLTVGVFADNAVGPIANGDRSPEVTAFAEVCGPEGSAGVVAETVLQDALYRLVMLFLVVVILVLFLVVVLLFLLLDMVEIESRIAGDRQIAVLPRVAVEMPSPAAAAAVQAETGVAGIGAGVAANEHASRQGIFRYVGGYAPGVHVHRAAHGTRPVEQSARSLDYLDAVREERLHRDAVVRTA